MLFGVAFYSFVIGNIQSIMTKSAENTEDLVTKLKALEDFKKKNKLKVGVYFRIKKFVELNYKDLKWKMNFDEFLPATLNDEILTHVYGDTVNHITLFKESTNKSFVWAVIAQLNNTKFGYGDIIYLENDIAKEMYFLKTGKVKLYYQGHRISNIDEGDYFGDIETLFNINRELKAVAKLDCILLEINKKHLEIILQDYPDIKNELLNIAKDKREKYYEIIINKNLEAPEKLLDVYGLSDLNVAANEQLKIGNNQETAQSILNKSLKDSKAIFMKDSDKIKNKKAEQIIEKIMVKQKPLVNIPNPEKVNLDNIDPLQNDQLEKVEGVIDN